MKNITFLLLLIVVIICLTDKSYSAKDTLPPNPGCEFCPCCGATHGDVYVEDMPLTYERSSLDTIILHKESFNYDFSFNKFKPGIDYKTKWNAKVHDFKKDAFIKITFIDFAGNDTTIQNNYYVNKIAIRPDLDFGLLSIGETKELDCRIINEGNYVETITRIKFRINNQGFEINGINLPFIIYAGDSLKFKVHFAAYSNGEFKDSIGFETYCADDYLTEVKAIVGSPRINVSNYDFGIRDVNTSSNCSILIWNQGTTNLIVTGYKGPKQSNIFIPYLDDINENNPITIPPKGIYSCEVMFIPSKDKEYTDTIFFISNTEKDLPDSIAELTGTGIIVEDVEDLLIGNIKLYPIPADDYLSINFNEEFRKPDFIKLFDSFGNVVYENYNVIEDNLKIRTGELTSGIYFLKIRDGVVRKVLIVH